MNKNILLLLSFILFIFISTIKCQDVGGIFEAGEEPEDEEFVGSNTIIDTPQVRVEGSSEDKEKKADSKSTSSSSSDSPSSTSPSTDDKFSGMDEEEFEGLDTQKTESKDNKKEDVKANTNTDKQTTPNQTNAQNFRPLTWLDFIPEFLTLSFILVYCAYYFKNNKRNEKKILSWMEKNRDILFDNFTSIKNIIKMSTNEFRVKCTGRLNCIGMEMNFTFKREHDLVYTLIDKFYPLVEEKVTIDIPVGETGTMPTFNLIMMHRSKIANFKKDNASIAAVTTEVQNPKFPNNMSILVDTKDLIPLIISKETRSTYKRLEKYIEYVYINDQHLEQPEFPNFIRFVFRIPPKNEDFRQLFLTCFDILDRSVELEMPKLVKEKVVKKRLELQKAKLKYEHEKREERAQLLKDERKKKLMESKDENSEKELSKLEAKEKKKNLKKASGKMKRVVVG